MSHVKSPSLASDGQKLVHYAASKMGPLMEIKKEFSKTKSLNGIRIGMALHVTKETANLVEVLEAGGAHVALASCNPLSTQDNVAAYLASQGTEVFAYKGETKEEYYAFLEKVIASKPQITIDDGCDLISLIHQKHTDLLADMIGGCEETTTGVLRLRAMEKDKALKYPVIAVNDNTTKHLVDNYYGTGQSTWDGILRATNTLVAGKTVVIAGYGDCGKGVALRAAGLGASVIITETDAFRALQARMDGYSIMPMDKACQEGDIFITVTGNKNVITLKHMRKMKAGVILANAGHFNVEIEIEALEKAKSFKQQIRPFLEEYVLEKKPLYVVAEGRLVNLSAAEGHPSEVMALSFCGQALACQFLVQNKGNLKPKVLILSSEIDNRIARLQLEDMKITIDSPTLEQMRYITSWKDGT